MIIKVQNSAMIKRIPAIPTVYSPETWQPCQLLGRAVCSLDDLSYNKISNTKGL